MPPKTSDAVIEVALLASPDSLDIELSRELHVSAYRVRDIRGLLGIPQPLRWKGLAHRVTDAEVDAELLRDPDRSDCQIGAALLALKVAAIGRPRGVNPSRVAAARRRLMLPEQVLAMPQLSVLDRGLVAVIEAELRWDHARHDDEIAAAVGHGCTPNRVYGARRRLGLKRPPSSYRRSVDPRNQFLEEELCRDPSRHDTVIAQLCGVSRSKAYAARKRLGLPLGPDARYTHGRPSPRLREAGASTGVSPRGVTPKRLSDEERALSRCLDPGSDKSWDPTAVGHDPGRDLSVVMPQLSQQELTAVVTHTPEPAAEVLAYEVAAALGLPTSMVAAMAPVPGMSAVAVGSARVLRPLPTGLPIEGVYREALVRQLIAAVTQSDEFHCRHVLAVQAGLGLDPTTLRRHPKWSRRRR